MANETFNKPVMIRLTQTQVDKLDATARILGGGRSEAMRAYLDSITVEEVVSREARRLNSHTQHNAQRGIAVVA